MLCVLLGRQPIKELWVSGIDFDDGQRVEAGDILVEMTSKEEHALIKEEKSKLYLASILVSS